MADVCDRCKEPMVLIRYIRLYPSSLWDQFSLCHNCNASLITWLTGLDMGALHPRAVTSRREAR